MTWEVEALDAQHHVGKLAVDPQVVHPPLELGGEAPVLPAQLPAGLGHALGGPPFLLSAAAASTAAAVRGQGAIGGPLQRLAHLPPPSRTPRGPSQQQQKFNKRVLNEVKVLFFSLCESGAAAAAPVTERSLRLVFATVPSRYDMC